jgi:hypothetical protein
MNTDCPILLALVVGPTGSAEIVGAEGTPCRKRASDQDPRSQSLDRTRQPRASALPGRRNGA